MGRRCAESRPFFDSPFSTLLSLQCAIDGANCQTLAEDGCTCQQCNAGWNENNSTGGCDAVRCRLRQQYQHGRWKVWRHCCMPQLTVQGTHLISLTCAFMATTPCFSAGPSPTASAIPRRTAHAALARTGSRALRTVPAARCAVGAACMT